MAGPEEWEAMKAQVMALLAQLRGMRPGETIQRLLQDLPRLESRVTFCAHLLGLLVLYVRGLEKHTAHLVEQLVKAAPAPRCGSPWSWGSWPGR